MLDCVLVRAFLPLRARSKVGPMLDERAWQLLVIHVVAATISSWEAKHVSPAWRSAYAVEPKALLWLKEQWQARASTDETIEAFVARWKAAWLKVARGSTENP
jgi:hypothetical protein